MVRRLISLLLAVALFGAAGQGAASAARGPDPMQSMHMSAADCMKMMAQAAPEKAAKSSGSKRCTPADCLNCMIACACAGIVATLPDDLGPSFVAYRRAAIQRPGLANPMRGRSLPPDIQPPIA